LDLSGINIYAYIYQFLNLIISGLFVLVIGVVALFFLRMKNARDVAVDPKTGETKLLCDFYTDSGGYYFELCRVRGNEVTTKKGGSYFVNAKCCYQALWKPGQLSLIQVGVQKAVYFENCREPIASKDMAEWLLNPERKQITAYMQRTALNESFQKNLLAMSERVWADIAAMAKFIKNVPYMFYGIILMLVLNIICIYMVYTLTAQVNYLKGLFG
jgi:hypothetical protein